MKAIIVSGGRLGDAGYFKERLEQSGDRLLIACDSGARHLSTIGVKPDVLMGDMDSIEAPLLCRYRQQGVRIVAHPPHKDYTDTELALEYALALKPDKIDIWGALGGRFDHALANLLLLLKGKGAGVPTRLVDDYSEMVIADEKNRFRDGQGCLVSLIALSPVVTGVTLKGFLYPLVDESLSMSQSRGISNIIKEAVATIDVGQGNLLIIRYRQKEIFPETS